MLPNKIDKEAREAKDAFLKALGEFNTTEIYWSLNHLRDHARKQLESLEHDIIRHDHFNRPEDVKKCQARMGYFHRLIQLAEKWRDAEILHSAPVIVEAITGRKTK